MPEFTVPNGDPLHEVNHCHGPGKGHPCKAGEGGGRSESELERERQRHAAEDTRAKMERSRHEREENLTVGDAERHEQRAKGQTPKDLDLAAMQRTGALKRAEQQQHQKSFATSGGEAGERRRKLSVQQMLNDAFPPPEGSVEIAPPKPRPPLAQRLKDRSAAMRRERLAAGGVRAEKQRKRDYQMAKGRQTQKTVRAIRKREE
jgi:hypothetical protein